MDWGEGEALLNSVLRVSDRNSGIAPRPSVLLFPSLSAAELNTLAAKGLSVSTQFSSRKPPRVHSAPSAVS